MVRALIAFSVLSLAVAAPSTLGAQTLTLQIRDGQVTLDAGGVSVQQILDEWARLGQVTIINAEALASTPTTIVLKGVSERTALDTLLRDARGYILGQRPSATPTEIDRIFIIPGGATTRTTAAPMLVAAPPQPPASFAAASEEAGNQGLLATSASPTGDAAVPPGTQPGSTLETIEDVATEDASTMTPPSQRPPTPIQRPFQAPDAANPFGKMPGSTTPGVISPVGPPPGFMYPPVTDSDVSHLPRPAGISR